MKKIKISKDFITILKDNQSPVRTFKQECNYSIDGNKIDGYRLIDGKKINFTGNKFFKDGKQIDTYKEFDENGKIISVDEYHERKDSKGNITYLKIVNNEKVGGEEFYLYNEKNKETLRFQYDPEGHAFTAENFYDELNRNTRYILKTDNELFLSGSYEYVKDRLVISETFDADRNIKDKDIEYFDKEGNPIYKVYYDNDGNYLSSVLSVYIGEKLIESVLFDSNHDISEWLSYKYDENENLIEETKEFYNQGELERTEIKEYEYEYFNK